ncbi:MAG: hypothetical protein JXQ29_15110 [Planctomycetes bacterium]|nr:hypothetical protein [Planctomycetota bacterium]
MEIDTRRRSPLKKVLFLYGPIFLVPAAVGFALVLAHFQGLPPRYATHMVFRVDPHLGGRDIRGTADAAAPSTLTMDPRSISPEIKSRDRLREALRGLTLYEEKNTDEKKQLLLEQVLENLQIKVEREFGQNAFLVTLVLSLSAREPSQLEKLLQSIRAVYVKYNVEQLISAAAQQLDRLRRQAEIYEKYFVDADSALQSFRDKKLNEDHLGDPPAVFVRLQEVERKLGLLDGKTDDGSVQARAELEKQAEQYRELHKNTPAVKRQHKTLLERREESRVTHDAIRQELKQAENTLELLRAEAPERFRVLEPPRSRPIETEQHSRLLLAVALGALAGLTALLLALLIGIVGTRE